MPILRGKQKTGAENDVFGDLLPQSAEAEPESETDGKTRSGRKKRVVQVDGRRTCIVQVEGYQVVSVDEEEHADESAARERARKEAKKRGTFLIWHSRDLLSMRTTAPPEQMHPKARAAWTLQKQVEVFGENALALSIPSDTENVLWVASSDESKEVAWADNKAIPGPLAVHSGADGEGAWLRIGWDSVDMTLVENDSLVAWKRVGNGIDDLDNRLSSLVAEGQREYDQQVAARKDFNTSIASEVDKCISEWQAAGWKVPLIWLHGPGAESSNEVKDSIKQRCGVFCTEPVSVFQEWEYLPAGSSWVPAALSAITASEPATWRKASSVMRLERIKSFSAKAGVAAAAVGIIAALWWKSSSDGSNVAERIAIAQERQAAAEQIIQANNSFISPESAELDSQASVLAEIGVQDAAPSDEAANELIPDWEALFDFWEVWAAAGQVEPVGFSPDTGTWSLPITDSGDGIAGNLAMRELLDAWLPNVWGHCARGVGGSDIALDENNRTSLTVEVSVREGCDPSAPPVETEEGAA